MDVFNNQVFGPGYWTKYLETEGALGPGSSATVIGSDLGTVTLSGTVAKPGDALSLLVQLGSNTVAQFTLVAAFDLAGGLVAVDQYDVPYLFSRAPLTDGQIVTGQITFGNYDAGGPVACFLAETGIRTPYGDIAVELLTSGTTVSLARGGFGTVKWTGFARLRPAELPVPEDAWPVRIEADAIGDGQPARPLVLSPEHGIALRGHLIPARLLVNGTSIRQTPTAECLYYHVELVQGHQLLLAEGLAVESYLDCGNRHIFENVNTDREAGFVSPGEVWAREGFAPLLRQGPLLADVKAELEIRGGAVVARLAEVGSRLWR